MAVDLENLEHRIQYQFSDPELVQQALTHRSAHQLHNERLEFLGDSLLGFIVAELLYQRFPEATEGELSRRRANFVKQGSLAAIARSLSLGEFLVLGSGELKSGGATRDSILADAVEALLAAVYLDGGLKECERLIGDWIELDQEEALDGAPMKDSKTHLQELLQAKGEPLPVYEVERVEGAAHEQEFHVSCTLKILPKACRGTGRSKRAAEQAAARECLLALGEIP